VPGADVRSEYDASWSRDGRRVAYVPYFESYSLVIANADHTSIRVLDGALASQAYGTGDGPQYGDALLSPAGDRAAFNVTSGPFYLPSGKNAPRRYQLCVVDVASGAVTTLYRPEGFDTVDPVEFSADGTRLLFRRSNDTTTSFWSVDVDGSNARQLLANAEDADWR
jgi:Tol biopolymer transport system component